MSNTGLIVGMVFLVVLVGGGYMFRKQIQAFIEKHTQSAGAAPSAGGNGDGEGGAGFDQDAVLDQVADCTLKACPSCWKSGDKNCFNCGKEKCGFPDDVSAKLAFAYTAKEINSYT